MKKALSLFLSLLMTLSVFSGVSFTASAAEVVSMEYKPAQPITLMENYDGYYYDYDGEEFFRYSYWSSEGDSLVLKYSDATEKTYIYKEIFDEDTYVSDFYDENGNRIDYDVYTTDDQYENHWYVGKHTGQFVCDDGNETQIFCDVTVTVVENPYKSVTYTPVKPIEIIEKNRNYGYWSTDYDGNECFYYYGYWPTFGDKLTVQLKNGTKKVYTYTENVDNGEDCFVSSNGDIIEYGNWWFENNQSDDNAWYAGCKNAKYTFKFYGLTCDIPVTIKENPYSSVEFIPAKPVQFIENTHGEMDNDENGPFFRYNSYYAKDGDKIIVHFTDKTKPAKTLVYDSESDKFVASDGSSIGNFYFSSNQCEEWTVGGKGYTDYLNILGFEAEFPVEIIENPYKSIKFIPAKPIEFIENANGYFDEDNDGNEYYHYYYGDSVFQDGNAIEVTKSNGSVVRYICDYYHFYDEKGNELQFDYYDNQYEEHWTKGGDNYITISAFGFEDKIPVYIIDNPVKNVEFSVKSITCKEHTYGHWYDNEEGAVNYIYSDVFALFKEGDTLTVNMKDGSSKIYTCKENAEGYLYKSNFFDEDGNMLEFWSDDEEQYDNPWGIGEHTVEFYIEKYDCYAEIPLIITKGTQQDCWHAYYNGWKNVNGYLVEKCVGCGYEVKLPFIDLSNYSYYGDFVKYTSVDNKFITGTNPPERTLFSPQTAITRAMFVTILYRMAGEPYKDANPYKASPFTDIADTSVYYYDAACWALDKGITTQKTFKPFDNVTREQTASFLFRYADDTDNLGSDEYKNVDLSKYSDSRNISPWAAESMQWANYYGMITGTQQGTANPQGATQRIHATKILFGFGSLCDIGNNNGTIGQG